MPRNENSDLSSARNPNPGAPAPAASATSGLSKPVPNTLRMRLPQTLAFVFLGILSSAGIAFASVTLGTANTTSLQSGLVGYWTFDGKNTHWQTGTTDDVSGNGNTGTLVNMSTTTSPTPGKIGGAFKFNASGYIATTNNVTTGKAASVSFWMKHPLVSAYTPQIFAELSSNFFFNDAFVISFDDNTGGAVPTMGAISAGNHSASGIAAYATNNRYDDGKWHQVVVVFDRNQSTAPAQTTIYVDGTSVAKTQVSGYNTLQSTSFSSNPFYIAARNGSLYPFDGSLDDVRIYNRALSAQEVQQLYALGAATIAHSNTVSLSSGLVGYWTLDGSKTSWTTDTTQDSSGNGNTGTLVSMSTTTSPTPGKIGRALKFDGASSNISAGTSDTYNLTNNFTASVWFKATTLSNYYGLVTREPSSFVGGWGLVTDGTGIPSFVSFYGGGAFSFLDVNSMPSLNTWHHLVGVINNGTRYTYLDGVQQSATDTHLPISVSGQLLEIGCFYSSCNGGYYFPGVLDDVRIYNRALSAQEIAQLYALGSAKIAHSNTVSLSSGLVGYWPFDGKYTHWQTNTTDDVSGNGNTGTLVNMSPTTSPTPGKIGGALKVAGVVNQYISVAGGGGLNNLQTGTISMWVKWSGTQATANTGYGPVMARQKDGVFSNNIIALSTADPATAKITWAPYSSGAPVIIGATTVMNNRWRHIVITYSFGSQVLYVDGVVDGTSATAGSIANDSSVVLSLGALLSAGNGYASASMDDVRVYNRILSPQEVAQLYQMGK